ncbi:MAG: methyltransferase domain-containing protein [Candidatus Latescibacterota bacterium]|nr:MAG: methyltransferase domain-containing protein [Candidatus Latescibacterota bacterium]
MLRRRFLEVGPEKNRHNRRARANEDWETMGLGRKTAVDHIADANDPWPFEDESFDVVYSSHVVEHLESGLHYFKEVYRVLKPGGWTRAAIPNAVHFIKGYLDGRLGLDACIRGLRADRLEAPNGHRHPYDAQKIEGIMASVGFVNIRFMRPCKSRVKEMRDPYFSNRRNRTLYAEGQKP